MSMRGTKAKSEANAKARARREARERAKQPKELWLIQVSGYGSYTFAGTRDEAGREAARKGAWEGGIGHAILVPANMRRDMHLAGAAPGLEGQRSRLVNLVAELREDIEASRVMGPGVQARLDAILADSAATSTIYADAWKAKP